MSAASVNSAKQFQVKVDFSSVDALQESMDNVANNFGDAKIVFVKRGDSFYARDTNNRHDVDDQCCLLPFNFATFQNSDAAKEFTRLLGRYGSALADKMNCGPFKVAVDVETFQNAILNGKYENLQQRFISASSTLLENDRVNIQSQLNSLASSMGCPDEDDRNVAMSDLKQVEQEFAAACLRSHVFDRLIRREVPQAEARVMVEDTEFVNEISKSANDVVSALIASKRDEIQKQADAFNSVSRSLPNHQNGVNALQSDVPDLSSVARIKTLTASQVGEVKHHDHSNVHMSRDQSLAKMQDQMARMGIASDEAKTLSQFVTDDVLKDWHSAVESYVKYAILRSLQDLAKPSSQSVMQTYQNHGGSNLSRINPSTKALADSFLKDPNFMQNDFHVIFQRDVTPGFVSNPVVHQYEKENEREARLNNYNLNIPPMSSSEAVTAGRDRTMTQIIDDHEAE